MISVDFACSREFASSKDKPADEWIIQLWLQFFNKQKFLDMKLGVCRKRFPRHHDVFKEVFGRMPIAQSEFTFDELVSVKLVQFSNPGSHLQNEVVELFEFQHVGTHTASFSCKIPGITTIFLTSSTSSLKFPDGTSTSPRYVKFGK